jgi:2-hydroxy-6-oxonona-2,4-dienedioate hydrolase
MVQRAEFESWWTSVQADSLILRIHSLSSREWSATGLPVVFVPGLGASGRTMLPTARLVSAQRSVFVVDPPSHGESENPDRPLSLQGYAAFLAAWLDALQLERAVLAGHSFGSQMLVELAVQHPARVAGLVLISPTVDPRARTVTAQLARLLLDAPREPPSLLLLLSQDYLLIGFRDLRDLGRNAIDDRVEEKLPSITAPTLVVRGERDPLVPDRWAEQIASLLHTQVVMIPKGTHAVQYQSADAVAQALNDFLTELSPSESPHAS